MRETWTREKCRLRYVQGQRIVLHTLAAESGVPIGTLKRWSSDEEVTWLQQRRQYDENVRLLTHQKSIELVSDAIAQSNEAIITEHLELLATLREMVSVFFKAVMSKIKEIEEGTEPSVVNDRLLEFLISLGGRCPLTVYSNALHLAIQGERQALYLDLVDPAILERAANRQGLTLIDLDAGDRKE
jgi:hypothetical protein